MKFLQTVFSSLMLALIMLSSNAMAAEKTIPAPEAIAKASAATEAALKSLQSGASAEEVNKLIKDAAEAIGEIYANYKMDKKRDTAIIHLKAIRAKVSEGKKDEAEEALKNSVKEVSDLKNFL